jgi:hypothetical protein
MVPRIQHLHGKPVAPRNAFDKQFIRRCLHRDGRLEIMSP